MTNKNAKIQQEIVSLNEVKEGVTCTIKQIQTDDVDMEKFLFSLGCFEGEQVSVISRLEQNIIITIKEARYSIDSDLASVILIEM
ncbi:FeoA family protein [Pasteurella skyensis]|uniref:FeoA family protein n=1 Tax=Phocoenobacter skyensis TaxID=97481 RepID=UPI00275D218D|nr:FeoA family protein [Pasteurella skyensis]MDP8177739.1 FeoA family protein [Pasteurella skyensis]MDP8200374.1 FeoA family protein [Pasteurella skyensis]